MMLFMYWLGLPAFLGQQVVLFKIADGAKVGGILVDVDYLWGGNVGCAQYFSEESLGCSSATALIQQEIECLAG